ncbi:uncharacterized protein LOC123214919 isoform X1 [Mangifera indica]|uniref:uncharacterized protein LOC123214919 isoform X1 n=1 Tax=Mangifera indica TaxID=29780 RepID=UPI001CFC3B6E|nr:uncharacterized protein LOC123214919 isoform X1 [Mangifera indica]XP_044490881.1 uncharacterized protein LOC123214919 isoform X1 [Mangifera indica]
MPPSYFPLRWESTGDQWWYASPIDFAAANGHYELVRELLHLDPNLLFKLTSLRRIRRLETVWDDEEQFDDVARCRSHVARKLLLDNETKRSHNSLIRAGYGGWLIYTAASAGDVSFVKELLERDPLLVFGEGEYGVTDVLYAAARSKNSEVFRLVFDCANCVSQGELSENQSAYKWEMMNRAVHAAARGGNLEILKELLGDGADVLVFRDAKGSTILHSASGRGQVEVVKDLIGSYDIITATDNQGNTALHVAAYKGYLGVVKVLIATSPLLIPVTNSYGDTFLHMAVAGFRTPGFRRADRHIELMKQLVYGKIMDLQDLINVRNNHGRTTLHMAVGENIQSNLVELLMTVPSINLNIQDGDGMTPLDLLKQHPRSACSEILIKQLISAGGISNCQDNVTRHAIVSHLKGQGIGSSPGSSFRIPDAEIFLYAGFENSSDASCDAASVEYSSCRSELSDYDSSNSLNYKKLSSISHAARRLKFLLQWPKKKERKIASSEMGVDDPFEASSVDQFWENSPIPLRQKYSKSVSFPNCKRDFSLRSDLPSPSVKKKFTAGLTHGVIQALPHLLLPVHSSSSPLSGSSMSSPSAMDKEKGVDISEPSCSNQPLDRKMPQMHQKQISLNKKLMNQYFCVGAQGLGVEVPSSFMRPDRSYKHVSSLVA